MKKLFLDILILSVVSFAILWLLDSCADAQCQNGQCPTSQDPRGSAGWRWAPTAPMLPRVSKGNPAIVRVTVKDRDGANSLGSGTVFFQERKVAYVLTAAHVISERAKGGVVVLVEGSPYKATVLRSDELWDVAILRIADPGVTPIQLADKIPAIGDSLECSGLGQNGTFAYRMGKLTQFVSPSPSADNLRSKYPAGSFPFEWIEVSAVVREGDSGGPIANTRGRLVGLITGSSSRYQVTVGPCLPRIRAIIKGIFPSPGCSLPRGTPKLGTAKLPESPAPQPMAPPSLASIDYNKLATAILKQIDPEDFRGPSGERGPAGLAGPAGPPGDVGATGLAGIAGPLGVSTKIDMDDLAERIKELINGSVRIKVESVPKK